MKSEYAKYLTDKTAKDYNLIAPDFSRTRHGVWEEILFLFDKYINNADNVLDIGCGNGRYYNAVKKQGANYTGIDNSKELIKIAGDKYGCENFKIGDGLKLEFGDFSFDKIISIAVLHHIPSENLRLKFLSEAKRVLKKDGLMIITVWKFHQFQEFIYLFKYTLLKLFRISLLDYMDIMEPWGKITNRYYHWFTKRELINLAKKSGMEILEIGITKNSRGNRQNYHLVLKK